MSSTTRLRRRLLVWRRYAARTCWAPRVSRPSWMGPDTAITPGHTRAWNRLMRELERRADVSARRRMVVNVVGNGDGDSFLEDDDRCCLAGPEDHPGPCVRLCEECYGDGKCPDCHGEDDLGCGLCGGSGSCPAFCDDGELVDDPYRPIVTVDTGGLT